MVYLINKAASDTDFSEELHPRDENGKFAQSGSTGKSDKTSNIEQKRKDVISALAKIEKGAREATVKALRNDLEQYGGSNDVTFLKGNEKGGIEHIKAKHGANDFNKIVDAVIDGKVVNSVKDRKVWLEKDGYTALLSLDYYGNKKTWLLTGYELDNKKVSDDNSESSTTSVATRLKPTFSRHQTGADTYEHIITDSKINFNPTGKDMQTSDKKEILENGYWEYKRTPITKAGVFEYLGRSISPELDPDKIYKVYRPAEEIEKAKEKIRLLPLIDEHEMQGEKFTDDDGRQKDGVTGEQTEYKDGTLYNNVVVFNKSMKDKIADGKRELSMGYECDYELKTGTYNGEHYDAIQKNIRPDHLALVKEGRMGHDVRVEDSKITYDNSLAIDLSTLVFDEFNEELHPRDDEGKFTNVGITHHSILHSRNYSMTGLLNEEEYNNAKKLDFEELKANEIAGFKRLNGSENEQQLEMRYKTSPIGKLEASVASYERNKKSDAEIAAYEKQKEAEIERRYNLEAASGIRREYMKVPYAQKEEAKKHGAKWDNEARAWYLPQKEGSEFPAALNKFRLKPDHHDMFLSGFKLEQLSTIGDSKVQKKKGIKMDKEVLKKILEALNAGKKLEGDDKEAAIKELEDIIVAAEEEEATKKETKEKEVEDEDIEKITEICEKKQEDKKEGDKRAKYDDLAVPEEVKDEIKDEAKQEIIEELAKKEELINAAKPYVGDNADYPRMTYAQTAKYIAGKLGFDKAENPVSVINGYLAGAAKTSKMTVSLDSRAKRADISAEEAEYLAQK